MSVSAEFYKFSKRKNSTKQPTGTGTVYNVDLKSGTSLLAPTLLLSNSGKPDFNYFKFEGMYYFVRDIVSVRNDLWEVYGKVDGMATAKTQILNTKAYVIYDTVANTEIPDNRLPMKTTKSVQAQTAACPLTPDSGCYILSLTGSNGSTGVYKVNAGELGALIDDVAYINNNLFDYPSQPTYDNYDYSGTLSSIGDNLAAAAHNLQLNFEYLRDCAKYTISQFFGSGNCAENIRQCLYIPFNRGTTYGPNNIYLGTFKTQQSLSKLATDTIVDSATVSIPWQTNDYRRRSPYTDVYLYIPYIGMVKLSSENLVGQSSVTVEYALSLRDGSLIATVTSGVQIIGQYSGNVGVSVPVGISNINMPKAAQSIITGIVAAASKNWGAIGMAAINLGESVSPNYTCLGGLDGLTSIATIQNITCYTVLHDTVVAPNTELQTIGSPTMAPKALSTLTGYCQCMDAHVDADLPWPILNEVDGYLNSGFFIE